MKKDINEVATLVRKLTTGEKFEPKKPVKRTKKLAPSKKKR